MVEYLYFLQGFKKRGKAFPNAILVIGLMQMMMMTMMKGKTMKCVYSQHHHTMKNNESNRLLLFTFVSQLSLPLTGLINSHCLKWFMSFWNSHLMLNVKAHISMTICSLYFNLTRWFWLYLTYMYDFSNTILVEC